jgi:hypothetical protein
MGIVDMAEACGAFVRQRPAAPEQGTGGTHVGWIDRGLRAHTTTQERRHLLRVDPVVCGLAPMDGLHREGMAEDTRDACIGTQVSEPAPGEHALDRHDETLSIRSNGLQEGIRVGLHMAMDKNLAALVEDAEGHGAGMQVDAAVQWMLLGGEAQEILCRRTGHGHGAMVKLLEVFFTKKALAHDHSNAEPHCL